MSSFITTFVLNHVSSHLETVIIPEINKLADCGEELSLTPYDWGERFNNRDLKEISEEVKSLDLFKQASTLARSFNKNLQINVLKSGRIQVYLVPIK